MTRKSIVAILAFAASGLAAPSFAASIARPSADEAGTVYEAPRYDSTQDRLARADASAAKAAPAAAGDPSWIADSSEAGWQLVPHQYRIVDGRVEHADTVRHEPAQVATTAPAAPLAQGSYSGA